MRKILIRQKTWLQRVWEVWRQLSGFETVTRVGTVAIGAAATAVSGLAKSSLDSYSSYEQLVGGVETLFKDSSDKVREYADNAYKTAGMSADQYMDTVTSFSATLLQGLGGDTSKAADYADTAIRDMADKMLVRLKHIELCRRCGAKRQQEMAA